MTHNRSATLRRAVRLAAAALVLVTLACAYGRAALAAPSVPDAPTVSASLEASADAVPLDGALGYTAHVRLSQPASYLQARLQVRRSNGQLVYQRTQVQDNADAGDLLFSFQRDLSVLDLKPGAYPAELTVKAATDGSTETTTVQTDLLVFDPTKPAVPVALVAKVYGQPLMGPAGNLVIDPATSTATKPRDDVDRVATMVTSDPFTSVTLSVPPVLLEQWRRISGGYTSLDNTSVPATAPTPKAYADTLTHLKAAIETGRLELVTAGYADPNISDLAATGLDADVAVQYDAGLSACYVSLETTPSTGTVPAGGCVPAATLKPLQSRGIGYVVSTPGCVRLGKSSAPSGAYPIADSKLTVLVSDTASSRALQSGETSTAERKAFDRLGTSRASQPVVVTVELGEGRADATSTVVAASATLETLSWVRLQLGRDTVVPKGTRSVTTVGAKQSTHTPEEYWSTVGSARKDARALAAALGAGDPDAASSQSDSLLAESSAWAEPGGLWNLADRGLGFAKAASAPARRLFGRVKISGEPVTLSGTKGEVPITIQNGTQKTMSVVVHVRASGGIKVDTPRINVVLRPRENYVQIPVDTQAALGGHVDVQVVAGPSVITRRTIEVRASSLDRLALLGAVFVVLVLLLAFVWRRVRKAEASDKRERRIDDAENHGQRYTDSDLKATGRTDDTP